MSVKAELKLNRISALDPSEFHVQLLICNISCPASPVAGPRGGLVKKKKIWKSESTELELSALRAALAGLSEFHSAAVHMDIWHEEMPELKLG